jgi:phosphatidylserine/phosphatidylglycerophosphate/cardiolipin synthase-like enzyme
VTLLLLLASACNPPPTQAELDQTRGGRVEVFFNDPGTNPGNLWDADVVDVMVSQIDHTEATLDVAVMGFSYTPIIDAVVRAHDRGVAVRFVGDAGHWSNEGYTALRERHVPMQVGNMAHIMHDKFMVSDGRFVFCGTSNWSETDLLMNSNNFIVLDNPEVAADFTSEFEQLFGGEFGGTKSELDNGRVYQVGDTEVEVWFSPNEDAMGRILELVDAAEESVRFTIFAFTKDQVGSAFIRKHGEMIANGGAGVSGVIDQSQLHSNGQYHEVYRLITAGIDVRLDGNDNTALPGDYQAGGGRLHSKTMLIDADGANPVVITGSFNWSASATSSNDEFLLVLRGERVRDMFRDYYDSLWASGRRLGGDRVGDDLDGTVLSPGDLVINEVMWYGVNHQDTDGYDEFIEIRNTTDRLIDLDLWVIANPDDVVVGLPPGSWVGPNDTFTILDHVLEPYVDGAPQDELSAFSGGDLIVNSFNDNRQSRLYLKDGSLELLLLDPGGTVVDAAGDGGPAFAGGPDLKGVVSRSMERADPPGDGADPASWYACTADQGGTFVNAEFADEVRATPDEPNSPAP